MLRGTEKNQNEYLHSIGVGPIGDSISSKNIVYQHWWMF